MGSTSFEVKKSFLKACRRKLELAIFGRVETARTYAISKIWFCSMFRSEVWLGVAGSEVWLGLLGGQMAPCRKECACRAGVVAHST